MPTYNCANCGQKHGPNDACGRGERTKRNPLREPLMRFGSPFRSTDTSPLWG